MVGVLGGHRRALALGQAEGQFGAAVLPGVVLLIGRPRFPLPRRFGAQFDAVRFPIVTKPVESTPRPQQLDGRPVIVSCSPIGHGGVDETCLDHCLDALAEIEQEGSVVVGLD
jgi:hypothetical protein